MIVLTFIAGIILGVALTIQGWYIHQDDKKLRAIEEDLARIKENM